MKQQNACKGFIWYYSPFNFTSGNQCNGKENWSEWQITQPMQQFCSQWKAVQETHPKRMNPCTASSCCSHHSNTLQQWFLAVTSPSTAQLALRPVSLATTACCELHWDVLSRSIHLFLTTSGGRNVLLPSKSQTELAHDFQS